MEAYLDHAASTPLLPGALEAMLPFLSAHFENPSSTHRGARTTRRAIDDARDELSSFAGCDPGELVFTSGGTEADNLAISGVARFDNVRIVVSSVEHHAVLLPAARRDADVVKVTESGVVDLDALSDALDEGVRLVSVMAVNNETGVVQPIEAIATLVRERAPRAIFHTDAVQAGPWCDVASTCASADMVSLSAHKFGGPKGVGALVVRSAVRAQLSPELLGGAQERELRAGTENVAGIVGAGAAARCWASERKETWARVRILRDRLEDELVGLGARANAPRSIRVPSIAPLRFGGVVAEELLIALDQRGVAASAGAACASGAIEPSHVLLAMGLGEGELVGSVRFSLGWATTPEEIDYAMRSCGESLDALVAGAAG